MTNITSLSQFLNSQSSQSGVNNSASSMFADRNKTQQSQTGSTTTEKSTDGDQITLSDAAKALLAAQTTTTKKNYGFTLTTQQQKDLDIVLKKYKDKAVNQTNFDAIQKDLKKLRLDTVNMSAKDNAKSFSVRGVMMAIMNGKDMSGAAAERAKTSQVKKDAYAKQIVADWTALKSTTVTT